MPVYLLTDEHVFPDPAEAEEDGLLAVGGDLDIRRLIAAYVHGIFPWYSDDSPILWWSPDPRLVLLPGDLKVSRSLRRTLARQVYSTSFDADFKRVIEACARAPRRDGQGTWITREMMAAYCRLHDEGYAHSVECWSDGELAGGLYGVALGGVFFGESMFSHRPDASKVALVHLTERLRCLGYRVIDCQVTTQHLLSMGAREIPRSAFLSLIRESLEVLPLCGPWDATV